VTLVEGKASVWGDLSGLGNGVTQATAAQQPTPGTGGVNGLPYLLCGAGGVYSQMAFATNSFASLTSADVFIVAKNLDLETSASVGGLWRLGLSEVGGGTLFPYQGNVYEGAMINGRINTAFSTAGRTQSTYVYEVTKAATTGAYTMSMNGAADYAGMAIFAVNANPILFSSTGAGTVFLNGPCYEFLMFSRVLSAGERASVIAYLKARYGIA
jgi:hypothetical protein